MRITKFIEGSFIPSFDGASERFHQGTEHLTRLGIKMMIIHCFRGWSDLDQIAKKNFKTIAIPPDFYYRDSSITSQAVETFKPDLLEVNDPELGLSTGLELSILKNIPLVFDAQFISSCIAASYSNDEETLEAILKLEQHLGQCISGATCFTKLDKEDFVKATKISHERVHVIPMGSDVEKIRYREINQNDNTIVFMGNMFFLPNQEGAEYIANLIAPKLLNKYPSLVFRFVGDAPEEIKEKYQSKNIEFTGRLENINDVFEGARICLAPITTGGGMRTKTLTYMASGVPVVSTPIGTIGIETNDTVLLANSPEEFIANIDFLLQNHNISLKIGQKARELVETEYSWKAFATQYLNFYHTVLKNPQIHTEQPISMKNDPLWLKETIDKGRFRDNLGNSSNIYLLGHGEKTIVPIEDTDKLNKIEQFLKI